MAEEKKEAKETKEVKEKPKETPASQAETKAPGAKRKKLSCLSLSEVEAALKSAQEKMGGFHSQYVQHLLLRKKALTSN